MTHRQSTIQNFKDLALLVLVFVAGLYVAAPDQPHKHNCMWTDCDQRGRTEFYTECEEGSDGYYFDLTHWRNPEWTYEECENYVFSWRGTEQDINPTETTDYN